MPVSRPLPTLPERFNSLESMLFAPDPARARQLAERYVGDLLARPAPPPPARPRQHTLPSLPLGA